MTVLLPYLVSMGVEACISLKRIGDFLLSDEKTLSPHLIYEPIMETNSKLTSDKVNKQQRQPCLELENICAKWSGASSNALNNISVNLSPGQLAIICGPVASGKTSLLMALLNELPIQSGLAKVRGTISYASQQAWIFSGTVRDNILFGSDYNRERYWTVVKVCSLSRDIELFDNGDTTYISDNGNSLSGGQKARISLARCLYKDCDIYLLDDPLSAVDSHVADHIFNEAIKDFLGSKAVIFATHQLQFLEHCDRVLAIDQGYCKAVCSYRELKSKNFEYLNKIGTNNTGVVAPNSEKSVKTTASSALVPPKEHLETKAKMPPMHQINNNNLESSTPSNYGSTVDCNVTSCKGMKRESSCDLSVDTVTHDSNNIKSNIELVLSNETKLVSLGGLSNIEKPPLSIEGISEQKSTNRQLNQPDEETMSREFGSARVLWDFYTGKSMLDFFTVFIAFLISQLVFTLIDVYLTVWTIVEQERDRRVTVSIGAPHTMHYIGLDNDTIDPIIISGQQVAAHEPINNMTGLYRPFYRLMKDFDSEQQAIVYTCLIMILLMVCCLKSSLFYRMCTNAARLLYKRLFNSALFAQVAFFDKNPIGRFLNRATRDMGLVDELMPVTSYSAFELMLQWLTSVILVTAIDSTLLAPATIIVLMFIIIHRVYVPPLKDIQRLENMCKSPILSHLSTSINGLAIIRSTAGAELNFEQIFMRHLDQHSSVFILFIGCNRWIAVVLDWINCAFVVTITLYAIISQIEGPSAGLLITSGILLCGLAQHGALKLASTESLATSIERINEYCRLPQEENRDNNNIGKKRKKKSNNRHGNRNWTPSSGRVEFKSVDLYYNKLERPVLNDLTLTIESGEKIGVVGRTGAGKSSILTVLFRLYDYDGSILIDNMDIKQLNLQDLRSNLSIIPQDPILFSNTVRYNIDPFNIYDDNSIWQALEYAQLKEAIMSMEHGLESHLNASGNQS